MIEARLLAATSGLKGQAYTNALKAELHAIGVEAQNAGSVVGCEKLFLSERSSSWRWTPMPFACAAAARNSNGAANPFMETSKESTKPSKEAKRITP